MESFKKQIYESFPIEADFSANMAEAETISEVTATAILTGGALADVVTEAAPSGKSATARVSGGVVGASYIITVQVVTSTGNKWELDIKMGVTA